MSAPLLPQLRLKLVDGNGAPYAAGQLYVYVAGTSTPTDTWNSSTLTNPNLNTNPVVADAAGLFGAIYLDPAVAYKFVFKTSGGVTVFTQDNVTTTGAQLLTVVSILAGTTTLTATQGEDLLVLADATAGVITVALYTAVGYGGQKVRVAKIDNSNNTVTVDPSGAQTVNATATTVLYAQWEGVNLASDGANWVRFATAAALTHWLAKAIDYTVAPGDGDATAVAVDATGAARTITTYAAAGNKGRRITVKKADISTNTVTLDGNAAETIDGALTYVLRFQYNFVTVESDGSNWLIVATNSGPVVAYPATLSQVLNTAAITTFCAFQVPAMADGDTVEVEIACLRKNNKGTDGTATLTVSYGGVTVATTAVTWVNNAAEYKQMFVFVLKRVGSDLWVYNASNTYSRDAAWPSGAVLTNEVAVVSAPTFTSPQAVLLRVTLSAADVLFYWKPQSAYVQHRKAQ